MIKTQFLVPLQDNNGQPFKRSTWMELERQLTTQFGGFSRETGIVGQWEHEGMVYSDTSRRYTVALQSWTQLPAWLELVDWVRKRFRQQALYVEIEGRPEVIAGDL